MEKIRRMIAILLAVAITITSSNLFTAIIYAREERFITLISDNITINAGVKNINGLVTGESDTSNLKKIC